MIDSHCHLNYDYSPKLPEDLVKESLAAGVSHLVTIGTESKNFDEIQKIAHQFKNVFYTVGVHPHEAGPMQDSDLEAMRKHAKDPKCRAIGEIGLDYFYKHSDPSEQKRRFRQQLEVALEVGLPVVIHGREADDDILEALKWYAPQVKKGVTPGVMHCFTSSQRLGEEAIALGFLISFSGILTFKSAHSLHASALAFPLEHLMVETDAPYLAPIPYRGKKCEPSMVVQTATKLAEIKRVSLAEVDRVTTENAKKFFAIVD